MHLNWIFLKRFFFKLLKPKSLFSLNMFRGNSKVQGWPLTFKPRSLILEAYQYIKTQFPQKPFGQLNSNFIWRLLKLSGVNLNQMLMVTLPRWWPFPNKVKKPFKYLLLWNQKVNGLGTWYISLGMWAYRLSGLTLIFFSARPNLNPNTFILEKSWNVHFSIYLFKLKS